MNSCLQTCPNLPTYSYQQQCLIQCPESTAIVGSTCQQCQERCQICQVASVCLECQSGYNLFNGICLVACPIASPYLEDGICGIKCSDSTYYYQKNCVIECPNKSYLQQCVDKCPDGYYGDVCSPCKSQCKTCSSYQTCNSCNPNYFLEQTVCDTQCPHIYDTIKWECADTCNGLLNGLLCIDQCPVGLVQQGSLCQNTCNDGYYNENAICTSCPRECQLCTSSTSCQQCSISYYLQDSSCLAKCPIGLFSDPKTNKCIIDCPNDMMKYQTQCLFSCPKGYVANKNICTQECSHNQLQIGQICFDCPLECDGCTGLTNSDCIQCSKDATQKDKACISKSCITGYTLVDGFCFQCQFNCLTCDQNSCLTCRGDRTTKLCTCNKGYFDDGVDDTCQKCPCDECTSINSCTKCKKYLKTPNCSCDRQLNSDWCIDCNVGRVNIKFSFDLNTITPSSCELWIVNYEILGVDSLCHLVWDRTQVIIKLGSQSTVTIGDNQEFQQNFYKDVNDQQCSGFISNFIDSSVQSPDLFIKPYVEFDNPQLISNCQKIQIRQVSIWGTGQRELQILQWKIINEQDLEEDHYFQLSDYLSQQGNYLEFEINVLKTNQTYIIQAKYTNILKRLNTSMIQFKTNPIQKPYVYLSFNPLTAHAYIFDCLAFQDLQLTYTLSILIQKQNDTLISDNILVVNAYSIIVDESKLPRGQTLLVTAQIDKIIIRQNVTLQYLPHLLKFKQQSRFLGLQGRITARGYDQNIKDTIIQQMNFTYQWVCTNLHNLEPCKSQQNQIIKFVDTRILQIQLDSPNQTFAFYCNASKDGRWTVEVQKIVITNLNIKNNFVENTGKSLGNINPNDDVFIILQQPQQYAMIMYQYLLIGTIKINGSGLKFKLADYLNEANGDIAIYLLPSNESLKYTINFVQVQGQLQVDPKEGYSLDQFTILMNITNIDQLDGPLKYGFFEYLKQSTMEKDVANFSKVNGIPLGQLQTNNSIQAHLTNGLEYVYLLCQVIDIKGFVVFFNQTIKVKRKYYSYQQNINALPKKNQSLQQINAALQMLKEESKQVCLKQCSGVGTCQQGKCQCPPGYYFDDCSGTKADTDIQKQYISNTLDELFNSSIADDEQYKLFIKSLSYLATYQETFDKFSSEKALVQLGIVINSLSNRINKINQLTINLQLNSKDGLQYDSMDIGQTVQMSDLKQTMQCHDLVWYLLLQNNTGSEKYQIQYQTRQIIQQIIQLSFYILKPDDFVDFSGAGGILMINRSNKLTIQTTQGRILSTTNQQFDLVQAKYLINLYLEDGYFPYPKQRFPLYDYSIRLAGRQQNIQLQYTINYTFQVEAQNRYICIMRNKTNFAWEYQNCNTTYVNKTIQCNCTLFAPTTIVDDQDYLVTGTGQKRMELPSFISLVLFIQTFLWICLLMVGLKQDRQILDSQIVHNQSQTVKYGMVKALNKQVRKSLNLDGIQLDKTAEPSTPEPFNDHNNEHFNVIHNTDHDDDLLGHHEDHQHKELIKDNKNIAQKYSLENFQKQHSILNIIYKYKKFQPRWFRATLILMRWSLCIAMAGLFAYLQLLYEVSIYPTLGVFLFSRMIETFINQQFKQTSYIDSLVLKLIYLTFIFVIIMSSLLGFWVVYTQIENQTDWIVSYLISFVIDILCLDLISMIANKYLGEDVKIRLRKQIKRIKKQHEMQKQIKSSQYYN